MLERFIDDRPRETSIRFVQIHEQFAGDEAVTERDNARAGLEPRVGHEARHKTRVQRAEVSQRIPDGLRRCIYEDFLADGRHTTSSLPSASKQPQHSVPKTKAA